MSEHSTTDMRQHLAAISSRIVESYKQLGGCNHPDGANLPSRDYIISILRKLFSLCFPGYFGDKPVLEENVALFVDATVADVYIQLRKEIEKSLHCGQHGIEKPQIKVDGDCQDIADRISQELLDDIPRIRAFLMGDVKAAYDGDPAAKSHEEVILSYPCILAIATYRIAHELYIRNVPFIPRIMSEYAHSQTGIDIHPGATIGERFFIDHGTGVVIGETTQIGNDVKLYQGVTLGALSFRKDIDGRLVKEGKRHPTIENDVVIYSSATILGGETVIGHDAVIGANVWLTRSIPPGTKVTIGTPEQEVIQHNARTA